MHLRRCQVESFPCTRSDAMTNVITIRSFSKNTRCLYSAYQSLLCKRPLLLSQVPAKTVENPLTWTGRRPLSALWGTHLVQVPAKTAEKPRTWTGNMLFFLKKNV